MTMSQLTNTLTATQGPSPEASDARRNVTADGMVTAAGMVTADGS
jgi:hypothetical protein